MKRTFFEALIQLKRITGVRDPLGGVSGTGCPRDFSVILDVVDPFTAGGADTSVESLKIGDHQWISRPPMKYQKCWYAVAVGEDKCLYVSGGSTGHEMIPDEQYTKTVSKFNSQANEWTEMHPMQLGRDNHAAVILGNIMYVIGGEIKGAGASHLCEKYYLNVNESSDVSHDMASLNTIRSGFGAVGHLDKIFVAGGMAQDGDPDPVIPCSIAEVYNVKFKVSTLSLKMSCFL